jgi:PadR family transcriptional regulator PadR
MKAQAPAPLGEFEYLVLLATLQLGDGAYPIPIRALIEERTGRTVARGALYTALDRLEAKGCVRSRTEAGGADRGGRPRRCFALTAAGLKAARATHASFARLAAGLEAVLERP